MPSPCSTDSIFLVTVRDVVTGVADPAFTPALAVAAAAVVAAVAGAASTLTAEVEVVAALAILNNCCWVGVFCLVG